MVMLHVLLFPPHTRVASGSKRINNDSIIERSSIGGRLHGGAVISTCALYEV